MQDTLRDGTFVAIFADEERKKGFIFQQHAILTIQGYICFE